MRLTSVVVLICVVKLTFATPPQSPADCDAQVKRCDASLLNFPNIPMPWFYGQNHMRRHPEDGDLFCRYSNDTSFCLRELHERCPEYAAQLPKVLYGWYTTELNTALTRLCAVMNPLQFMAAKLHCDKQTQSRDFTVERVIGANLDEYIQSISNCADGVKKVCKKVQMFLSMPTELKSELTVKCGKVAMDIIANGMRKSLAVYPCPNPEK